MKIKSNLCIIFKNSKYTHVIPKQKIDAVEKINYIFENTL